jgi:hypothetical protein
MKTYQPNTTGQRMKKLSLLITSLCALGAGSAFAYTVPNTADLLFGLNTDSFPASGPTGAWARNDPAGGTFTTIGTPTVDSVGATPVKWEKNVPYASAFGFSGGTQVSPISINGMTIVTAIKPLRNTDSGNWRSIVDVLYDQFCLTINNNASGRLGMRRAGVASTAGTATAIPDQQSTVVSVVMAADGTYKMYANGTPIYTNATAVSMPTLTRASLNTWGIGRNTFDGWSTYNGDIGDVYVWKIALADADRVALENDLMAKFHAGAAYPANAITASTTGGGGTITPAGAVSVPYEADQIFTIAKNYGFSCDVVVDSVSQGDISTYTFTDVVAAHTIAANYTALPTRTIAGNVSAAAGGGATVSVKMAASSLPSQTATTDASGNYTMAVPTGVFYVCASQTGYMISADTVCSATGNQTINFTLAAGRNIPAMENLLFAADANNGLGAVGTSGNWPLLYCAYPGISQLTAITTPVVTKVRGLKYDYNLRTDGDGYRLNTAIATASIPTVGATIVALVKPVRNATSDGYNSLVDIFYSNLILGIKNNTGQVQVRRNGTDYWSANDAAHTIPDGQFTILSLVLQSDGTFSVWASVWNNATHTFGTPTVMLTNAVTSSFTAFIPAQAGTDDYRKWINVGRNNPDGWSVYNGYIGDTFVYKTALSDADRATVEADINTRMNSVVTYNITATAGANGTISPAGVTTVGEGDNQTYTITPAWGYDIADVKTNGVSVGAVATFTFANVMAGQTIDASFVAKPTYAVSGQVTNTSGTPIVGAKVYVSTTANASISPIITLTTDASGNYSVNLFNATWYVCASATGYTTSADTAVTVAGVPQAGINFALAASGKNIPAMDKLLFSLYGTALTVSGATTSLWPLDHPKGLTAAVIGTPVLTTVDGLQWEKNRYASSDGYRVGQYLTSIPVTGVTATAVVQPNVGATNGNNWSSVIDVFYSRLVLCVRGTDGLIRLNRNGTWTDGPVIPNGQKTVLSVVVQPTGQYQVFTNGILVMNVTTISDMTSLVPGVNTGGPGNYDSYINVGRNNPDGWTTYAGNIGAAFLWKTALTQSQRVVFESELGATFGIVVAAGIAVTSSANPSGYQDSVSFTATVTPSAAVGTVQFKTNGTAFGSPIALSGSPVTSPATASLPRGTNVVTAEYSGSANYLANVGTLAGGQIVTNHPPVPQPIVMGSRSGLLLRLDVSSKFPPTDVDGDICGVTAVNYTGGHGATVTSDATGINYTSVAGFTGMDTLEYTVSDGHGGTGTAIVTVYVTDDAGFNLVSPPQPVGAGTVVLTYLGIPGYLYALQHTTSLSAPVAWSDVATNATAADGRLWFTNTPTGSVNYYRTRFVSGP